MKHRLWAQVLILSVFVLLPVRGVWSGNEQPDSEASRKNVKELVEHLQAEYLSKRTEAKKKLIKIGAPAVPELIEAARSSDFRKRRASILALGQIGDQRALPLLIEGYLSNEPSIKQSCRSAIMAFGSQSFEALEKYSAEHPQVESEINELLDGIVQRRVEEVLYGEVSQEGGTGYYDGQFRELKPYGRRAIAVLKNIVRMEYNFAQEAPFPPKKVKGIIDQGHISNMAISAIGRLGSNEDISFLQPIAPEVPSTGVRAKVVAIALHRLGHSELLNQIRERIESEYRRAIENDRLDKRSQIARIYQAGTEYASLLSRTGSNKKAIQVYRKLLNLKQLRVVGDQRGLWYYNIGCSYAQLGKKEKALKALRNAYEAGYRDAGWLNIDGDMDPLREKQEFQDILDKMKINPVKESVRIIEQGNDKKQEKEQQENDQEGGAEEDEENRGE